MLNDLLKSDFNIVNEAISSSNGVTNFIDAGYGSSIYPTLIGSNPIKYRIKQLFSRMQLKGTTSKSLTPVETMTLDSLINNINAHVDLVQIDVQGFEYDVLKGAVNCLKEGDIKTFLIGTHGARIHRYCVNFLRQHGYEIKIDKENTEDQPDGIIVACKSS